MKELGRDNYVFNITSLICCLTLQLFQTDKPFMVKGSKRIHTQQKEILRSLKIWEILSPLYLAKDVYINEKSFIVYKAFNLFASM